MAGGAALDRWLDAVRMRVLPHYDRLGGVTGAYAQGSLVEGLAAVADLDVVLVWATPWPTAVDRSPAPIADAAPAAVGFDEAGFVLDRFYVDGQQVDVKHVSVAELSEWIEAVERADASATAGYPMPVVCLHGLTTGVVLRDSDSVLATVCQRADAARPSFAAATRRALESGWPNILDTVDACVHRGDGMLFSEVASGAVRIAFVAWFAAQGRWWPHEKRLGERLRRLGRHDLAEAEANVWAHVELGRAAGALRSLGTRVLLDVDPAAAMDRVGRHRPVWTNRVIAYDPAWPAQFEDLARVIRPAVEPLGAVVEHIGSTSVPGLAAKPIVDVLVVADPSSGLGPVIEALEAIGYVHEGEKGVPDREAFDAAPQLPYHHLYAVPRGSAPHLDQTELRDHLRRDDRAAARYGDHKLAVAHHITHESREAYVNAKSSIVAALLEEARRPRPPVLVLLNGPPGIGKSTVAKRLVASLALSLCLDIDDLRSALGDWQHDPRAKRHGRDLAVELAAAQLRRGHDVVIPQLVGEPSFIDQLASTAAAAGGAFVHVVLLTDPPRATDRFRLRRTELAGRPHPQDEIDEERIPSAIETTIASIVRITEGRDDTIYVDAGGTVEETVALVAAAAWPR